MMMIRMVIMQHFMCTIRMVVFIQHVCTNYDGDHNDDDDDDDDCKMTSRL